MASIDTKRKMVNVTYQQIAKEGLNSVRARDIADEVGCNVKLIYKYFGSLSHLIKISCLRFLEDYNKEIIGLTSEAKPSMELNLAGWKLFAKYAFENPPVYEKIFWGEGDDDYNRTVIEYFKLFPEEKPGQGNTYYYFTVYEGNLEERDYIWLRKAANEGMISLENASFLSKTDSMLMRAALLDHMEDYQTEGVAEKAAESFIAILKHTYDLCVGES